MPSKRKAKSYSRNKKSGGDSQTEERKIKISSFLEDFDSQVQIRINKTNSEMEKLCSAITFLYQREIMKLPKKLREMKFKDFVDQGGSVDSHCAKRVDKSIGEVTNNVTSVVSTISSETSTKSSKTEENPLPTKRKGQPPKSTTQSAKTQRITRSSRKALMNVQKQSATPLNTKNVKSVEAVHNTPAVTPKFDPRLPLSLAVLRQPKAGEIIMSLGGSPLQNTLDVQNKKTGVTVSLGDGTVVNLPKESTEDFVPNLSHSLKNELFIVQQKISQLIQLPKS